MADHKLIIALSICAMLITILSRCSWLYKFRLPSDLAKTFTSDAQAGSVRILFHTDHCSFRGHEVAAFEYAFFGELLYYMQAYHTFPEHAVLSQSQWNKLESFFPARVVPLLLPDGQYWRDDPTTYGAALDTLITHHNIDYLYKIEDETERDLISTVVPTLMHATVNCVLSHGQRMMAISSGHRGHGCAALVPHMVWTADCGQDSLRNFYGIPDEAVVYGWIGGDAPWDPNVTVLVRDAALALGAKIFFLLQDFPPDQSSWLQDISNVLLITGTSDDYKRCSLGQTLDILLHPQAISNKFGRAAAEVSLLRRPILSAAGSTGSAKLQKMYPCTYIYNDYEDLKKYFLNISSHNIIKADFASLYKPYSPRSIMSQFNKNFFDNRLIPRSDVADPGQIVNLDMLAHHQFIRNGVL